VVVAAAPFTAVQARTCAGHRAGMARIGYRIANGFHREAYPDHRPREPIDVRCQGPCLLVTNGRRLPQNLFGHGTRRLGVSFVEGLVHSATGGPKRLLGLQLAGIAGTLRRVIEGFDCAPVRALMSGQTGTHGLIGQRVDPIQALGEKGLCSLGWIKVRRGSHFEILQLKEKADGPGCKVSGFSG
jgi:hypothetical protein